MVIPDKENKLGQIAFIIFFARRALVSVVFLVVAVVLVFERDTLANNAINTFAMSGGPSAGEAAIIFSVISYAIIGLFALTLIVLVVGLIVSWLEYINYSYTFEEFNLKLKRGIINKEIVSIPYRQMQDINIQRGLLYLLLGVSKVIIDSAGHEEADEMNETDIILDLTAGAHYNIWSYHDILPNNAIFSNFRTFKYMGKMPYFCSVSNFRTGINYRCFVCKVFHIVIG